MARKTLVVCPTVADLPIPKEPCEVVRCKCCDDDLWIWKADLPRVAAQNGSFVCMACLALALRQEQLEAVDNGDDFYTLAERRVLH